MSNNNEEIEKKRVSFSQLSNWIECFHKHYLISIAKKIPYDSNEYTAYGSAIHDTLEKMFSDYPKRWSEENTKEKFTKLFKKELYDLIEDDKKVKMKLVKKMLEGYKFLQEIYDKMDELFPGYEVLATEYKLDEKIDYDLIEDKEFYFTGYIDLIIRHENKIYIVDYKTSMKGWSDYSKQDSKKIHQLPLYRHYYAQAMEIECDDIIPVFLILNLKEKQINEFRLENLEEAQKEALLDLRLFLNAAFKIKRYDKTGGCYKPYCTCDEYYSKK